MRAARLPLACLPRGCPVTTAERLAYARWLRKLPERTTLLRDDRARLERLADELEHEGLEQAVEEQRAK